MLLGIDIGNTRTKMGLFGFNKSNLSIKTKEKVFTKEKLRIMEWIKSFQFSKEEHSSQKIKRIICSNVVPSLEENLIEFSERVVDCGVTWVSKELETGLIYEYEGVLGADRITNASGARAIYGAQDMIVIDFGTATTFCVITESGKYLGGLIMPGFGLGLKSLMDRTEQLVEVNGFNLGKPVQILGRNMREGIESGTYHGLIGSVEWIVKGLSKECELKEKKVIATGGYAKMASRGTKVIDIVDMELTMKGLEIIHQKNQG